jgi:hypothetical protein
LRIRSAVAREESSSFDVVEKSNWLSLTIGEPERFAAKDQVMLFYFSNVQELVGSLISRAVQPLQVILTLFSLPSETSAPLIHFREKLLMVALHNPFTVIALRSTVLVRSNTLHHSFIHVVRVIPAFHIF